MSCFVDLKEKANWTAHALHDFEKYTCDQGKIGKENKAAANEKRKNFYQTEAGMEIKKIHRVIAFEQSCWMKSYIDLNIQKRKEAGRNGDKVSKDLFKLFNNAVFGKTMENLRKQINFEIVTSRKIALKRIARPNFQRAIEFREDLVGVHMAKPLLVLNRPIQVGFTILDLSKYLMYDFHYNKWIKQYPNSTLLFTPLHTKFLVKISMKEW